MCFGYYDIGQFWLCFQIECKHVNALLTMSFVFWLDENTCSRIAYYSRVLILLIGLIDLWYKCYVFML
jgi:hypothetical protein